MFQDMSAVWWQDFDRCTMFFWRLTSASTNYDGWSTLHTCLIKENSGIAPTVLLESELYDDSVPEIASGGATSNADLRWYCLSGLDYVPTGASSQSAFADTEDGDLRLIELNVRMAVWTSDLQKRHNKCRHLRLWPRNHPCLKCLLLGFVLCGTLQFIGWYFWEEAK